MRATLQSLTISLALLCASCASTQRIAPRFIQPDTTQIVKAHAVIQARQAETKTHIQKAEQIVSTLSIALPADKLKVDALTTELNSANMSNDQLNDALSQSNGAVAQLQTQLKSQTDQANRLATDYDAAGAKITGLQVSRHGWVKRFWIASGLLLIAGLWIFKKPILAVAGGI